jgi:tetratricopeptide (TPR) repeat protein
MKSKNRRASTSQPAPHQQPRRPADSSTHSASQAMSPRRKWLFRFAAAIGIPALTLGLLELSLHLLGYGYPTSFFIKNPVPGENTIVDNRQFSRRYFSRELMRIPGSLAFSPVKADQETLRIFVFGESAAEGDPAPAFGFARILQVLLREHYPGRKIEVINTAVTAINSHVIRPIAYECVRYSGDVWLIYMGNNEVVGPFGAGTVFGPQAPSLSLIRASIAVKGSRTGQLIDNVLLHVHRGARPQEWEGMEMFLKQQVRQDDPRMTAVYAHFQRNLSEIVGAGVSCGAKVIVSTVGSNLRDCPPFGSLHLMELAPSKLAEWESKYQAGVGLETQGKFAEAILQYQQMTQVDDRFAELHFRLARCYAASGSPEEARRHYTLARDLDTLRFRADSHLNDIVRRVASEWQKRGVHLADTEAALARESSDGIPGEELFYEHVHLTFQGNYIVARQLADLVVRALSESPTAKSDTGTPFLSAAGCAERLGLTDWERLCMAEAMLRRARRPPFTNQLDHEAQIARQERILAGLRQQEATNFQRSVALYARALARGDDDWQLHDRFAGALLQHGDREQAVAHWRRVTELIPHRLQTYDLLGSVLLDLGKFNEAEAPYQQLLQLQPHSLEGLIGLGRVRLGQQRGAEALAEFRRAINEQPRAARVYNHLGMAFLQLDDKAEAEKTFRAALRFEPDFLPARLNLGKTLAKQGKLQEAADQYAEAARRQPDDFDAQYTLANALVRLNRLPEAAEHFLAALRLRPSSFEAHLNYGTILGGQGRSAEALAEFEEALRLKPDFAPAHLNLGIALSAQNQLPQAIAHFQEVLRQDPANDRARRLLEAASARQRAAE